MKPTQSMTSGNSHFTSRFEAAPKIFPLISLYIGELNKRGGLDSIGLKKHSPVSPLLELRSFRGQVSPLDPIFELDPTFRGAQPRGP